MRHRRSIPEWTRSHNEYDRHAARDHKRTRVATSTGNCKPGTRWRIECNSCWCSDKGLPACTLMECSPFDRNTPITDRPNVQSNLARTVSRNSITEQGDKHTRVRRSEDVSEKCTPGTTWKNDCNTCWCTDSGISACTIKGCLHVENNIVPFTLKVNNRTKRSYSGATTPTRFHSSYPENEEKCKHGTTWMDDCNRCRCFGGRAACTRMMCTKEKNRHFLRV